MLFKRKNKSEKEMGHSSRAKSREQEILKGVRYRNRIIIFLGLALILSIGGLVRAPHVIDVYQPPDLRFSAINEQDHVPPTSVYSFASYIFTLLNTWTTDGMSDYKKQASQLNAYFTPSYFGYVYKDAQIRLEQNELRGRTRTVTPADGATFSEAAVKIIGPGAWVVYLDLHVVERVDNNIVKDTYVRYPLRIVKREMSRAVNPWQLAIDGYYTTPERLLKPEETALLDINK